MHDADRLVALDTNSVVMRPPMFMAANASPANASGAIVFGFGSDLVGLLH
jgi:hypothetical protein